MTDRIDHRAAAEGELLNAIGYVHDADLSKADRAYQCINFALIHALLAIHDTLTDRPETEPVTVTHPWSNPLTVTHPWPPWPSTPPDVDAADRYAANEARQREEAGQREGQIEAGRCCTHARCPGGSLCCCTEAGPDPLDEDH